MRAGKLRHRVEVQSLSESYEAGVTTQTWSTDSTRWAAIEQVAGQEYYSGYQLHPESEYVLEMRYFDGLTSEHRIKYESRIFDIKRIRNADFKDHRFLIEVTEQQ